MRKKNTSGKNLMLARIANYLIINASFLTDLGLYHGKMGIVLFFAHYARRTGEAVYDDFAGTLMDEIAEEIHMSVPINFENGLSGIGWAVEYLINNKFMGGNTNELLSGIDEKIMENSLRKMSDTSIRTGSEGILYYITKRLETSGNMNKPFNHTFLQDYESVIQKCNIVIPDEHEILSAICEKVPGGDAITKWHLGLENGCAGYGLNYILKS